MVRWLLLAELVCVAGCGAPSGVDGGLDTTRDASVGDASVDAGAADAGRDAGAMDSGTATVDAGQFEQLLVDAGAAGFNDVWTNGVEAWIVGGGGLLLRRGAGGVWASVDAGTDGTFFALAVDGLGRVHAGGRTSNNEGLIATSVNGVSFVTVSGPALGQGVRSIAVDGARVYASADQIVFLDGGAWDRSMPQPASGFPGVLAARGGELWSTGFGAVQRFVDGGWTSETTGGELQMGVCLSALQRTVVSEHGFSARAQADAGFAWVPWMFFDNEPVGCAYSPNGTLWVAVNSIHLGAELHGSVFRARGDEVTEWRLPLLRAISASDTEVMVIGSDSVWRITP